MGEDSVVSAVLTYVAAAAGVLGVLAVAFGALLAVAHRFFRVHIDPRQEKIEEVLPSANCGSCGYGGCAAYAEAVAKGEAPPDQCTPGGPDCARAIARIMGVQISDFVPKVAVVKCQGSCEHTHDRFRYVGERDCRAATATQYGQTACPYGCLGLGSCVAACPFDAMVMDAETGLPRVLEDRCTACGTCAEVCPKNIIEILPKGQYVHVLCRNRDPGKVVRKACEVGCIACRRCEKACPVEGSAVHVNDNLAAVDMETCINCGKCVRECPVNCIGNFRQLRREAEKRSDADAA
jgi:RnfABCDGE-type electron transport complex B subunit